MYHKDQFGNLIGRVLKLMDTKHVTLRTPYCTLDAVDLLMGTAAQESQLGRYLYQIKGPAKGAFQIEPNTDRSRWAHYLAYRPQLRQIIFDISGVSGPNPLALESDLAYQIIMCRLGYRPIPKPLPAAGDVVAQADYWKRYHNTKGGRGKRHEYIENYRRYAQ